MHMLLMDEEEDAAFQAALSFLEECEPLDQQHAQQLQAADFDLLQLSDAQYQRRGSTGSSSSYSLAADVAPPAAPTRSRAQSSNDAEAAPAKPRRASKKRPPGYNTNRARDARKDELIYLRNTVSDLEDQLKRIKTENGDAVAVVGPSSSLSCRSQPRADSPLASIWEDMAARQFEERRRAELENIRLKNVLEQQLKVAKGLERLLHKRKTWQAIQTGNRARLTYLHGATSEEDDAAIFQHLLEGLEQSLQDVDSVFEANGLCRMETQYRDAQVRHEGANGMVLEIFANKLIPFEMHATGSAVWRHFAHSMENMPSRVYYHQQQPKHIETTPDTIVESFGMEIEDRNRKGDFHVRQILRKRVEEDRIVIVWRCLMETVAFSAEPTTGIRFRERGYIIIKRPKTLPADKTTLMQTCYIITPDIYGEMADQEQKIGALTDFVLNSVAGTISASHQLIENFLLDQVMRQPSPNGHASASASASANDHASVTNTSSHVPPVQT